MQRALVAVGKLRFDLSGRGDEFRHRLADRRGLEGADAEGDATAGVAAGVAPNVKAGLAAAGLAPLCALPTDVRRPLGAGGETERVRFMPDEAAVCLVSLAITLGFG